MERSCTDPDCPGCQFEDMLEDWQADGATPDECIELVLTVLGAKFDNVLVRQVDAEDDERVVH